MNKRALHGGIPPMHGEIPSIHGGIPSIHGGLPSINGGIPSIHGEIPSMPTSSPAKARCGLFTSLAILIYQFEITSAIQHSTPFSTKLENNNLYVITMLFLSNFKKNVLNAWYIFGNVSYENIINYKIKINIKYLHTSIYIYYYFLF